MRMSTFNRVENRLPYVADVKEAQMKEIKLKNISFRIAETHELKIGFDEETRRSYYYFPNNVSDFNRAYWNKSCVVVTENGKKTLQPRKEYEEYFAARGGYSYTAASDRKGDRIDFLMLLYKKGTGFENGKKRVDTYYQNAEAHSKEERLNFLKKEHGTGGGTFSHNYDEPCGYYVDAKGIKFEYYNEKENASYNIKYSWSDYDKVLLDIVPGVEPKIEITEIKEVEEESGQLTFLGNCA